MRYLIRELKINPYYDTVVYVNGRKIALVLVWLRDDSLEYMRHLIDLTCVDHIDRAQRFNIWYTGLSCTNQKRYSIFTSAVERELAISAMHVFKSLNWAEREAWDMFGVPFRGHEDLRRILTDYGFKGFPLRKNYPVVGYWEKYWDEAHDSVRQKLVTLMQASKLTNPFFDYRVKWLKEAS
jgi:NADH-quinone oxidoreductase subunit C